MPFVQHTDQTTVGLAAKMRRLINYICEQYTYGQTYLPVKTASLIGLSLSIEPANRRAELLSALTSKNQHTHLIGIANVYKCSAVMEWTKLMLASDIR